MSNGEWYTIDPKDFIEGRWLGVIISDDPLK